MDTCLINKVCGLPSEVKNEYIIVKIS